MSQILDARAAVDRVALAAEAATLMERLFPLCRSITGEGVRATLAIVGEIVPLEIHEVPSGTEVLDWTVPPEWNARAAYIVGPDGERVADLSDSNLHLVSYSVPVRERLDLAALRPHLHSLPDRPDLVPYRTSYYERDWGFCLADRVLRALPDGEYEVVVDTSLDETGSLTYAEAVFPGTSDREILVSAHVCHPSLANDNLSGIATAALVGRALAATERAHTVRILFAPGTIGAITWLAGHRDRVEQVAHGIVLTGVGGPGPLTYKASRRGDAPVDRAFAHVLATERDDHRLADFSPWGYDERQFCSPGFDLPVGRLSRTPHGEYPEYHTSADDLRFVDSTRVVDAVDVLLGVVAVLEGDARYRNARPFGEPQLGRRGLYRAVGGAPDRSELELAMLWVLNASDGSASLLEVAARAELPFPVVRRAADLLIEHDLLESVGEG